MFLSSLSIKRPILVSMFLSVFLLFGTLSYFSLTLNLVPELDIAWVTVQTIYPGAGPEEIETQITEKIEDAIATVSGINAMNSFSMESVSFTIIEFEIGKNPGEATQEVKDKINTILNTFPDDAELPIVDRFDINAQPIMDIILTGNISGRELFELAENKLKDRFAQVAGVARVNVTGGVEREIRIELDNRAVYQYGISLVQLNQILSAWNLDMPGGHFKFGEMEYSVRMDGEFDQVEDLLSLEIPTAGGLKTLNSVATITDGGAEVRKRTSYFNVKENLKQDNVVLMSIIKSSDGNTVELVKDVKKILPEMEAELPPGSELKVVSDNSVFIKSSVEDTLMNIVLGIILTALVLLFFLHDIRSTLIVSLSMPMSIMSTFLLMQMSGFSLNMMSLMGLSTSVGILVTNSVVVLENIFRHKELGHNRKEAADIGTAEIVVAVVASALTNVAVFLPIATMSGVVGQFFKEFALTVTFATAFSLLMSFTLTPMMASIILPQGKGRKNPIGERLEKMFHSWETGYKNLLQFLIKSRFRSAMVVLTAVLMFFGSFFIAARVGFEFMPFMDQGDIAIEVELPPGFNLDQTAKKVSEVEAILKNRSEIKQIVTRLGSLSETDVGTNLAVMNVKLVDSDQRVISSSVSASQMIEDLANVTNAKIRVAPANSMGGGQAEVGFSLQGQDMKLMELYSDDILSKIKGTPGLVNLNTSARPGSPEFTITPNRRKLTDAGLTSMDLAMTLRSAVEGMVMTRFKEKGNEYDIRVVLQESSLKSPEDLGNLTVAGPEGRYRLAQFAEIHRTKTVSKILHENKYKSIQFTGGTTPEVPLGDVVAEIRSRLADLQLPSGYRIYWGGTVEEMEKTSMEMLKTFLIAIILTYMLLAAILESLTQPFMILGTVPLAMIGVFTGMFITGKTMNIISMMAVIMLLGVVVNNAILMLDYTNALRRKGRSVSEALLEACPTKLKPIIMASVAIILGMMPMALGIGSAGVEFRQPMGIVSIGGLIVSTVMALVVIPAVYHLTSIRHTKQETV